MGRCSKRLPSKYLKAIVLIEWGFAFFRESRRDFTSDSFPYFIMLRFMRVALLSEAFIRFKTGLLQRMGSPGSYQWCSVMRNKNQLHGYNLLTEIRVHLLAFH